MKSTRESIELSNALLAEVLEKIPGTAVRNKAITTSSIYCKTPDGYSLRIGDHRGREKYSYKWNLGPQYCAEGRWVKEFNAMSGRDYWRFYTSSVDVLATAVNSQVKRNQEAVERR